MQKSNSVEDIISLYQYDLQLKRNNNTYIMFTTEGNPVHMHIRGD